MTRRKQETVGKRLRRLRKEAGLSQRKLSEPGVSYAYISRVESDNRNPSVKALRKLAPKLGVTVEYLEHGKLDPRDVTLAAYRELLRVAVEERRTHRRLIRALRRELGELRHPEEIGTLDRDLLTTIRDAARRVVERSS